MKAICLDCMWLFQPGGHYNPDLGTSEEDVGRWTCMAFFPDFIPDDILDGKFAHHTRHPKQPNDIVFAYGATYKKPPKPG